MYRAGGGVRSSFAQEPGTVSVWFNASLPFEGCGYWSYNDPTLVAYGSIYWALSFTCGFNYPQYYVYLGSPQSWNGPNSMNAGWNLFTALSSSTGSAIYINGVLQGTSSFTSLNTTAGSGQGLNLGSFGSLTPALYTTEDEVRFLSVQESPSWILTEYNNRRPPGTFYSVGSEL